MNGYLKFHRKWLLHLTRALDDKEYKLYLLLAARAAWDTKLSAYAHVQITVRELSRELGLHSWSIATVSNVLQRLEGKGFVSRENAGILCVEYQWMFNADNKKIEQVFRELEQGVPIPKTDVQPAEQSVQHHERDELLEAIAELSKSKHIGYE